MFGRLWQELGLKEILEERLKGRKFSFPVERVVFASVLHRLFEAGSDRQCHRFLRDVWVPELGEVGLHHLYRAMGFLGEVCFVADRGDGEPGGDPRAGGPGGPVHPGDEIAKGQGGPGKSPFPAREVRGAKTDVQAL